jgi:hypothetical protein
MKFAATLLSLVGSAALAQAATITFWTLDDATRTITFTSNENRFDVPSVTVNSGEKKVVTVPDDFVGMFYAVQEGQEAQSGHMLGEVQFGGWNGATYFDVSGIDTIDHSTNTVLDRENIKQMWPTKAMGPVSGCESFPCDYFYVLPDDKQTWVTQETDLTVTLGQGNTPVALNFHLNPVV